MALRRSWFGGLAAAVLVAGSAVVAVPASAASPQIERTVIDDVFDDEFLTEACGVPVVTRAKGLITDRFFTTDGTGLEFLRTINITLTATHDGNSVRFKDVGADFVRVEPDGTVVLAIIGQVPFDFTGILKINLETGEVIQEPQHFTGDTTKVCAKLTA
jgi:hypothetical protein